MDLDSGRGLAQAIRWVFPTPLVTPLRGQQVVGRDESCDTVLSGNEVSRRHAEFRVDGPVAAVRDLQSRNGVFVNGSKRADAPLARGDVIRCGEWVGIVARTAGEHDGFREIAPGWFGGARLAAAVEHARRLNDASPVVVQGEAGTGKEGMARAIHAGSGRSGPFVPVTCASLPGELAEAELFGTARGGSLFLDEILDLPAALQPKLLRVLEDGQVHESGETQPPVDVRIIAASREPLAQAVTDGRFRADLQARLEGLTVVLPPLRARREDITPLFQELLRQHCGGPPPVPEPRLVETLCLYDWPLNVRELALLARRLLDLQGHEPVLRKNFLPKQIRSAGDGRE